jgi:hypothetical protein
MKTRTHRHGGGFDMRLRTFSLLPRALLICSVVASFGGGVALGQDQPAADERDRQADDEVVVTGQRVGQLRVAVQKAREHAYGLFNQINSNNDFDFRCSDETREFSRATVRVCRPRFESRITSAAAKEWILALTMSCPADSSGYIAWQACMTGAYAQRGQSRAQAVAGEAPGMHERLNDGILRLATENEQFGRAILDFYAAQQAYDAARSAQRSKDETD